MCRLRAFVQACSRIRRRPVLDSSRLEQILANSVRHVRYPCRFVRYVVRVETVGALECASCAVSPLRVGGRAGAHTPARPHTCARYAPAHAAHTAHTNARPISCRTTSRTDRQTCRTSTRAGTNHLFFSSEEKNSGGSLLTAWRASARAAVSAPLLLSVLCFADAATRARGFAPRGTQPQGGGVSQRKLLEFEEFLGQGHNQ